MATVAPDNKTLAIAASDAINVWDFKARSPRFVHEEGVSFYDTAFSADGTLLAGTCRYNLRVWDLKTKKEVWKMELSGIVTQVAFSNQTPYLVFATMLTFPANDSQGWIHIHDAKTFEPVFHVKPKVRSGKFAVSANGRVLAHADGKEKLTDVLLYVRLYDMAKQKAGQVIGPLNSQVMAVCLSPDGNLLFVGTLDGKITVWDTATGRFLSKVKKHSKGVRDLSLNQAGTVLASSSWAGEVIVWKIKRD